jgi:hypothetical protein
MQPQQIDRTPPASYIPMQGDIVLDMVNHFDQDPVVFPCYDLRPINGHNALCLADPRNVLQLYLQNNDKTEQFVMLIIRI